MDPKQSKSKINNYWGKSKSYWSKICLGIQGDLGSTLRSWRFPGEGNGCKRADTTKWLSLFHLRKRIPLANLDYYDKHLERHASHYQGSI